MKNHVDENNYPLFDGLVGLKQKPMKTAMQELLEWHRKSIRSYSETNKMIEALLEKEKEQIVNDYGKGKVDLFMFYKDLGPDKTAEDYYNQTYNQNK